MKRNDLFNNNHSRQTTSIPFMQAKSGTVYTELSTNQVLAENMNQSEDKESYSFMSAKTKKVKNNRRKSHFEPFWNPDHSEINKTER